MYNKGSRRRKNKTVGNRHMRISVEGRGMGRGTQGKRDQQYMDFQEGKQVISSRWVWGGLSGVEEIRVLDGGRDEMVVNTCFKDLEGGVGLQREWEFVPEVGKDRGMKE